MKNSKGEVERWQGELTAPNELRRAGWTKHSLNPGDQITVTGFQGKNGGIRFGFGSSSVQTASPCNSTEDQFLARRASIAAL